MASDIRHYSSLPGSLGLLISITILLLPVTITHNSSLPFSLLSLHLPSLPAASLVYLSLFFFLLPSPPVTAHHFSRLTITISVSPLPSLPRHCPPLLSSTDHSFLPLTSLHRPSLSTAHPSGLHYLTSFPSLHLPSLSTAPLVYPSQYLTCLHHPPQLMHHILPASSPSLAVIFHTLADQTRPLSVHVPSLHVSFVHYGSIFFREDARGVMHHRRTYTQHFF